MSYVDIVFDGPPGHESGRFVEVENADGRSENLGQWLERDDGYWVLRITSTPVDAAEEHPSPSLERVAVLEEDNKRLRSLVYALSDTLTDEGADWSSEGVDNLRDRCARELPDVEWLQLYLKDQADG